jgi:hypothetical protein
MTKNIKDLTDIDKFYYCHTLCPYMDKNTGWCYYRNKDDTEINYNICDKNKRR